MIDAKVFIFVEMMPPFMNRVRYVTDMTKEKTTCKAKDFYEALKTEHVFKRDTVDDIKTKLSCGMCLIIDLAKEEVFRYDELEQIKIRSGVTRRASKTFNSPIDLKNKQIEDIVNTHLFKQ